MAPPSSPSDSLVARVRRSCMAQVADPHCSVTINDDKIRSFVEQLDWQQYDELKQPARFPLNFKSVEDEANFLTLLALLNFGSGYRKELHKYCERGAAETILFGLIGMYISAPNLNANYLSNISIDVLANYFSIPLDRDEELSPGIYISKPGPLRPLVEMMHKAVTESSQKLLDHNYPNFGAFIMANLRPEGQETPSAVHLVERLVTVFPAFDDHRVSLRNGNNCYLLKRAQLVAASLYRRFHGDETTKFAFEDMSELTALSDNVLPCVLRALGILTYNEQLSDHIDQGKELLAGDDECDIRAAACVACDRIVQQAKGRMDVLDLDTYLWRIGKEPRFRGLERHATRNTFFY